MDRHNTSLKMVLEVVTVAMPRLAVLCSWNAARKPFRKGTEWWSTLLLVQSTVTKIE